MAGQGERKKDGYCVRDKLKVFYNAVLLDKPSVEVYRRKPFRYKTGKDELNEGETQKGDQGQKSECFFSQFPSRSVRLTEYIGQRLPFRVGKPVTVLFRKKRVFHLRTLSSSGPSGPSVS